jgi:hypothetical protein
VETARNDWLNLTCGWLQLTSSRRYTKRRFSRVVSRVEVAVDDGEGASVVTTACCTAGAGQREGRRAPGRAAWFPDSDSPDHPAPASDPTRPPAYLRMFDIVHE